MARTKKKAAAAALNPKSAKQALFDDFLPHLIARLAYQLNADLIEKLRREGINVTRWRILAVLAMGDGSPSTRSSIARWCSSRRSAAP